jgi:hypothetical protein
MVKRVIYPPMWLAFGIVTIFVLNEFYPGARYTSVAGQVIGAGFILIGLVLLVIAGGSFRKAGTDMILQDGQRAGDNRCLPLHP